MAVIAVDAAVHTPARDDAARLAVLDAMRGFAALAVACYHFFAAHGIDAGDHWWMRVMAWGWLGVPVFFVISGYVIPLAAWRDADAAGPRAALRFIARRWLRVIVPMLAAAALGWIAWWASARWTPVFGGTDAPALTFELVACHVTATCAVAGISWLSPVFWTLGLELQFYLVVALAIAVRRHVGGASLLLVSAVAIACGAVVAQEWIFAWLPLFALGVLAWRVRERVTSPLLATLGFAVLSLAAWWSLGRAQALAAVVATVIAIASPRVPRVFVALGTVSFSLYLIHVVVGGRVVNVLAPSCGSDCSPAAATVIAIIALAVSLGAAWVFYRLVERPALALSRRVGTP